MTTTGSSSKQRYGRFSYPSDTIRYVRYHKEYIKEYNITSHWCIVAVSLRGAAVPSTARATAVRRSVAQPISAKYRGHGTDLSKVPDFQRHENDSGSPEAQIARMSARVLQLTEHLREHKTDYSTRRGLMAILSKRKQLLKYLRSKDKAAYERCLSELGIRQLKTGA